MIVSAHHRRSVLRTRVIRKIEDIPAAAWNRVYPDILESYDFLRTLDELHLEQFSFYYILVYERKALVGAATCFLLNYSLDTSVNGSLRRLSNRIKRYTPNIFSIKTFVRGMPIGQGRIGVVGRPDRVVRAILRRMEQIAKKERAAIVAFKDFDASYTGMLDPLQREGFSKFDSLPTTMMNIWFTDFEQYLNTLSAASRYDLRRKFKKVDHRVKIDLSVVDVPDEETLREIYRLYLAVVTRHDMMFELLPIEFFRAMPRNMPKHVKFFLWRIDGKLVAFLFALLTDEYFIDYYVGLDYDVAHNYHLYFVKFRDVLNWCIKNRIKKYEMGITGYEPKRRLGFDFVPLYLYVKLRNRALRPAFRFICQFLKFENFDPALKEIRNGPSQ